MKRVLAASAVALALGSVSGCGKIAAGIASAAAHHADDGVGGAARAAASEEMEVAARAAAQTADDATHGPKPTEEALEAPAENPVVEFGRKLGEEAISEGIEQGVTSALSADEDER